jgi:ABC-type Na+ efflux pump permease subunit
MAFEWHRARAVFWKDTLDLLVSKALLASMLVMPLVFVTVPVAVVWVYCHLSSEASLRTLALFYEPHLPDTAHAGRFVVERTLTDWFGLYLVLPVFVPILISSQSVAGEKERRTLEPLLASPITSAELMVGKSLAALLPALLVTVVAYAALCVGVDVAAWRVVHAPLLPNVPWSVGIFAIAPLFAFFGNGVAVLVSARVGEARLAQQLSALVVLPLLGLAGGQVAGLLRAGPRYYALEGGLVLLLDLALVALSFKVFDRERLISRWG